MKNRKRDHSGSTFDSFLEGEGIREGVEAVASKRVLVWQLEQAMQKQRKTKQTKAKQTKAKQASRAQKPRRANP
jgi:antitoxin HicB